MFAKANRKRIYTATEARNACDKNLSMNYKLQPTRCNVS
jgi:hypothetical protein